MGFAVRPIAASSGSGSLLDYREYVPKPAMATASSWCKTIEGGREYGIDHAVGRGPGQP